ncbi:MAG: immunoglobulin-like domain-containing protein, partial [Turicibacter sp.]
LEIENEGQWYIVPFNESAAFIEIGYMLDPYKTNEEVINLSYFKELPSGKYRVIKTLSSLESDITVAAEFEL